MNPNEKINFMSDLKRQMQSIINFQERHAALARVHMFRVKSQKSSDIISSLKQSINCSPKPPPIKKGVFVVPRAFDHTIIHFLEQRNSMATNSLVQRSFNSFQIDHIIAGNDRECQQNKLRNMLILNTHSKPNRLNSYKKHGKFRVLKTKKRVNQSAFIHFQEDDYISLPKI